MRKYFLLLSALFFSTSLLAQEAKKAIKENPLLSASNYLAYPEPTQALTPAPAGYYPFYISHYGRHGSRYLIGKNDYDKPYFTLLKADSLNQLTAMGKDVLQKVRMIRDEAKSRDGELTLRGAEQHKGIAKRMYENFPEVFVGKTHVDAKSTTVIRCILSMENALQQLLVENPQLVIRHDASVHDMYYMNQNDPYIEKMKHTPEQRKAYADFEAKHLHFDGVMNKIFKDENYWKNSVDAKSLNRSLFALAGNIQSTELRHSISLYNLFTDEEIYDNWQLSNAWWYIAYGPSKLSGGVQPFSQRNLLRRIIHEADSCMSLPQPGATLRYGHDTMVMPLTCLLDLDGLGKQIDDLDQLDDENWCDYQIFPMACNIQFVFYRKNKADNDILFKVLRNEKEATLPIKTDRAPYYHWSDFKNYFLNKIDEYEKAHPAK